MTLLEFQTGETITFGVKVDEGDPSTVSGIVASCRKAGTATPIPFTTTPRAAAGSVPEGWDFNLIAGLDEPGDYEFDVRYSVGGGSYVTPKIKFKVRSAVTPP